MPRHRNDRPVAAQSQDAWISGSEVVTSAPVSNPLENSDPKAPRKYKTITLPFNKYEFDRLDAAVVASGMGKNAFIREALETAYKKVLKGVEPKPEKT